MSSFLIDLLLHTLTVVSCQLPYLYSDWLLAIALLQQKSEDCVDPDDQNGEMVVSSSLLRGTNPQPHRSLGMIIMNGISYQGLYS